MTAQGLFCPRLLPLHLRHERLGRSEFRLGPDPADEENLDRLAVKIAGKIEQKSLQKRLAIVERRAAAVARHAVIGFCPHDDADGIDAVAQTAAWVRQKIGRRKSQCPAEALAVDDLAQDGEWVTEQSRGSLYVA